MGLDALFACLRRFGTAGKGLAMASGTRAAWGETPTLYDGGRHLPLIRHEPRSAQSRRGDALRLAPAQRRRSLRKESGHSSHGTHSGLLDDCASYAAGFPDAGARLPEIPTDHRNRLQRLAIALHHNRLHRYCRMSGDGSRGRLVFTKWESQRKQHRKKLRLPCL